MKKTFVIITSALCILFASCSVVEPDPTLDDKDLVEGYKFSQTVSINYGEDGEPQITNPLSGQGVEITNNGQHVTIRSTMTDPVCYELKGTCTEGSVKIYGEEKFKLSLNGLDMSSTDSCAINIQSSKRCFLVLEDGTTNKITDGAGYPTDKEELTSGGEDKKGAFFSEGQVIVSGNGTLELRGRNKHALATDEYLRIRSGNITITNAASDGLHVKEYYWQEGGEINVNNQNDGLQCSEGYIKIDSGILNIVTADDGILTNYGDEPTDTEAIDASITINGGDINIIAMSGKGMYSNGNIYLNAGKLTITCTKKEKVISTNPTKTASIILVDTETHYTPAQD